MAIGKHLAELGGLPAFDFPHSAENPPDLPAADAVAWRISVESWRSKHSWADVFASFLDTVDSTRVRALIIGNWSTEAAHPQTGGEPVIEAVVAAAGRLPQLRALFHGDITWEENEISWIRPGPAAELLRAYPALRELGIRGSEGLVFPPTAHRHLETLTIQSGGTPRDVLRGVAASDLPALTTLDLWLGTSEYGGDGEVADLAPILAGDRLPALRHLGLRNSEIQDDICTALAAAPVLARLHTLDLSMGVLTDRGATALLGGQPLTHLKRLDLHYNYLSAEICDRLRETLEPAGVDLDLDSDGAEDDVEDDGSVWRFVSCGE
ncbi:STM4015 family protein [Nocardia fusca]|uniref:STM4015 family protein n=1 Tax=Nocardia fusca TaxID=941183 RepID=UPI0037C8D4DC